jgi:TonB family protein
MTRRFAASLFLLVLAGGLGSSVEASNQSSWHEFTPAAIWWSPNRRFMAQLGGTEEGPATLRLSRRMGPFVWYRPLGEIQLSERKPLDVLLSDDGRFVVVLHAARGTKTLIEIHPRGSLSTLATRSVAPSAIFEETDLYSVGWRDPWWGSASIDPAAYLLHLGPVTCTRAGCLERRAETIEVSLADGAVLTPKARRLVAWEPDVRWAGDLPRATEDPVPNACSHRGVPPESRGPFVAWSQLTPVAAGLKTPGYTEAATRARITGRVELTLAIRADGTVARVLVRRPLPMGLDQKAVEAATTWRFEPRVPPEPVQVDVGLDFALKVGGPPRPAEP